MTNVPFTALIKSKGYNKDRLARACGISPSMISQRICGSKAWGWDEASRVCHTLDISYDENRFTVMTALKLLPEKKNQ